MSSVTFTSWFDHSIRVMERKPLCNAYFLLIACLNACTLQICLPLLIAGGRCWYYVRGQVFMPTCLVQMCV